jgi:hypothetical protein
MTTMTRAAVRRWRPNGLRQLAAVLLTSTLLGTAACGGGDSGTGPSGSNPAGSYSLAKVDQSALPFEIYRGPYFDEESGQYFDQLIIRVVGGDLTLNNDRFTATFTLQLSANGQTANTSLQVTGDYEILGNQITFDPDEDLEVETATLQNGAITIGIDFMDTGTENRYSFRK